MDTHEHEPDLTRRFGGVSRLYGDAAAKIFEQSRVCVVGVGGVGSWAAEALARTAIGQISLVDLDMIAESNTNRQIHALGDAYGMAKVDAMHARILAINPTCKVNAIDDFLTEDNAEGMLAEHDFVLDAIDNVRVKAAIAATCRRLAIPLVMCGSAGGKSDPRRIAADDLLRTVQDPMLAKVRKLLRGQYGFSRSLKKRFEIDAIFSHEPVQQAVACDIEGGPHGLSCAGYGSAVVVTASMGLFAAARVLDGLAHRSSNVANLVEGACLPPA